MPLPDSQSSSSSSNLSDMYVKDEDSFNLFEPPRTPSPKGPSRLRFTNRDRPGESGFKIPNTPGDKYYPWQHDSFVKMLPRYGNETLSEIKYEGQNLVPPPATDAWMRYSNREKIYQEWLDRSQSPSTDRGDSPPATASRGQPTTTAESVASSFHSPTAQVPVRRSSRVRQPRQQPDNVYGNVPATAVEQLTDSAWDKLLDESNPQGSSRRQAQFSKGMENSSYVSSKTVLYNPKKRNLEVKLITEEGGERLMNF